MLAGSGGSRGSPLGQHSRPETGYASKRDPIGMRRNGRRMTPKIAVPPRPSDVKVTAGLAAGKQCCPAHRVPARITPRVAKASLSAVTIVPADVRPAWLRYRPCGKCHEHRGSHGRAGRPRGPGARPPGGPGRDGAAGSRSPGLRNGWLGDPAWSGGPGAGFGPGGGPGVCGRLRRRPGRYVWPLAAGRRRPVLIVTAIAR